MSYPGHSLSVSYLSAEEQWVYYAVPADWSKFAEFYGISFSVDNLMPNPAYKYILDINDL